MQAVKRLSESVIERLRSEIFDAGGNEIFALGYLNDAGIVVSVDVLARGNEGAVLALDSRPEQRDGVPSDDGAPSADVLIHNHPSGFLTPSDNDLAIAGRAAENGTGSFIINNEVSRVYVVAEPARRRKRKKLDPDRICAALEEGGAIARRLPSFELRPSQIGLMRLIIKAFNDDALAAAEAGTGVGKSFAYILPAMTYALDNDERIVVSTATINLQQQLYEKDIPLVASALGKKVKVVLVKGRGNYLCRRRLEDALREPALDEDENSAVRAIAEWAETSGTGSRSDLSFLPTEGAWSRVCSEADLCMGMRCPERERCFVLSLRKECAGARILVVNHHLLFADLAARSQGAGYDNTVVLPPYRRIVIDEAHTVEGAATSFFSREFSRLGVFRQLGRLYRKRRARRSGLLLRLAGLAAGGGEEDTFLEKNLNTIQKIREAADDLDANALELCRTEGTFRLTPAREEAVSSVLTPHLLDLRRNILSLAEQVRDIIENLQGENAEDPAVWEIKVIIRRLEAIAGVCSSLLEYREHPGEVMWLERHTGVSGGDWTGFNVTPIDVAPSLKDALFEPNKTVICVSATLTVGGAGNVSDYPESADFGDSSGSGTSLALSDTASEERRRGNVPAAFAYWSGRSGFGMVQDREALFGWFPSPFPYARSVLLAAPRDAPLPDEGGYRAFVDRAATALAETAGGSALILFTSYDALRSAYAAARPVLEKQGIRCLKQGDDDRSRLLQSFLSDETSVLFATDSFWEGVDAPGDALRLVILCRLPFKAPTDPVFEARCEALESRGGSPFMELSLPESVMKFKQGFGRLMRRSSDHGVVAVLDGRILRKRYGVYFLRSLPKTRISFADFDTVLRQTEEFLFS
ncbi:MAG: ATP-dependent DNA helicase DinG [Treponema sp.]|nr:ATP-dependent DNA helicase DinG [Treponema sp.]